MIRPNKTLLDVKICRIEPQPNGWGANVVVSVEACGPAKGYPDFVRAARGAVFNLFTSDPGAVSAGKHYRLHVSLVGGPGGQRLVIEKAIKADGPAPDPRPSLVEALRFRKLSRVL